MKKHSKPYFVRQQKTTPATVKKPNPAKYQASQEAIELERAQSIHGKERSHPDCFMWVGEYDVGW